MTGYLLSLAAGTVPMFLYAWFLYYLDKYEKEPLKLLLGMFLWGALIAAGAAFVINSIASASIYLFTQSNLATQLATSALIAPFVEETLKGIAVLLVFILYRPEFDSLLDGIVYGGIAALGFAASENTWYIHQYGFLADGFQGLFSIALVRVVLVGWQHPFYTAFTGLGFALARRSKETIWRWAFPVLGWCLAIAFHFLHNLFAVLLANAGTGSFLTMIWDWSGYLGLLILIFLLIQREQKWMKEYLAPVRDEGLLSESNYQIATSAWRQSYAYLRGFTEGRIQEVRRYYQACGDLMHKIRQAALKSEPDSMEEIERLRGILKSLAEEI